ncbi:hypothetical protein BpHYR1_000399 [Brachionus plicatilis]|uniref:Uncharacterized protein n=1 Tax=Brachionus plicatilis TaxID=10195 RepID=A0A3M7Q4W5_BRAPC|nr:hypothetical protein BpHYR1_000399 [Brachionus plicatilis]
MINMFADNRTEFSIDLKKFLRKMLTTAITDSALKELNKNPTLVWSNQYQNTRQVPLTYCAQLVDANE